MVSVDLAEFTALDARIEQLRRSIDYAIRDLLVTRRDQLSLSCYLWVIQQHRVALVTGAELATWGAMWAEATFVDKVIERKRDDQLVSASLCAAALVETPRIQPLRSVIANGINGALPAHPTNDKAPLGRASYGAIVLLSAAAFGIMRADLTETVVECFNRGIRGGRAFGVAFSIMAARYGVDDAVLATLLQKIRAALADPETDYEDQIYLAQALWLSCPEPGQDAALTASVGNLLRESPLWLYVMSGEETIPTAASGDAAHMAISHLCRAALLDLSLRYREGMAERAKSRFEERYRIHAGISVSAFILYATIFLGLWIGIGWYLVHGASDAWQYLFVHNYSGISWPSVLIYQFVAFSSIAFVPATLITLATLWQFLVRARVGSDIRLLEVLHQRNKPVYKFWYITIGLGIATNIYSGIIGPAVQHMISGD